VTTKKGAKGKGVSKELESLDPQMAVLVKALLAVQNKEQKAAAPLHSMDQDLLVKTIADHFVRGEMGLAAPFVAEFERRRA